MMGFFLLYREPFQEPADLLHGTLFYIRRFHWPLEFHIIQQGLWSKDNPFLS